MSIFSMKKRKFYTAVSLCAAVFSLCLIPAAFGSGTIETVAGPGDGANLNDGGPAVEATLNSPTDVFVDDTGFYIADSQNKRIRRVNLSDGIISTVAGGGISNYTDTDEGKAATSVALSSSLNGVTASGGIFYIADEYNKRIFKVENSNISTVVATSSETPLDVIVYGEFLYVSYNYSYIIKKINISSGESSIFAGQDGIAGLAGDGESATSATLGIISALAVDSDGNIYLADSFKHRIRKVAADTGIITIVAGSISGFSGDGGLATSAKLKSPKGVAVDMSGNVYIADTGNNRIRKVNISGYISTVAGDGTAAASNETNAAIGDGGEAILARLNNPKGLSVDSSGNLYIADSGTNRIRKITFTDSLPDKGDLNASGAVDLADAITGLRVLAGIGSADVRADVDRDGQISMGDVIAILKYVADGTPL